MDEFKRAANPTSPQTPQQRNYVRNWARIPSLLTSPPHPNYNPPLNCRLSPPHAAVSPAPPQPRPDAGDW